MNIHPYSFEKFHEFHAKTLYYALSYTLTKNHWMHPYKMAFAGKPTLNLLNWHYFNHSMWTFHTLKDKRVLKQCLWATILDNGAFFATILVAKWYPKRYCFTDDQTVPKGYHFVPRIFLVHWMNVIIVTPCAIYNACYINGDMPHEFIFFWECRKLQQSPQSQIINKNVLNSIRPGIYQIQNYD